MIKYFFLFLILCNIGIADPSIGSQPFYTPSEYQSAHDWDHASTSFALQIVTYGLAKRAFHLEDEDAMIMSIATTLFLTFSYTAMSSFQNNNGTLDTHTLLMNTIGQSAAIGTIYMFSF
jgi:hypothetical protein